MRNRKYVYLRLSRLLICAHWLLCNCLLVYVRCHDFEILRWVGTWCCVVWYEPRHDKTNKMSVRPAKTQISLGIHPVWSEFSLSAWGKLGSLATHWAHSEDADQTVRFPRLIWVFAGRTLTLLVLSCRGSYYGVILQDKEKSSSYAVLPSTSRKSGISFDP